MPWLQFKIQTDQQHVETISDWLMEQGCLSVTYQDAANQPLFEPPPGETPIWANTLITGLFDAQIAIEDIRLKFTEQFDDVSTTTRSEILEDKDWVREWMIHYQPMQFGQSLWIVPSHHRAPDPAATNILLDPGLAFGTGTHPTTAMCLSWLAKHPPISQFVIDYGCGSGILAIAAAKLGAERVQAIDNDPQALLATNDNADKNGVIEQIQCGGIDMPMPEQADTLIANILAGPLIELCEHFSKILTTDGNIVLSGILQEQANQVIQAYQKWFSIEMTTQQEDWILLSGKRNNEI